MILGHSPFSGDDEDELFHSICNDKPYYPHSMNKEAVRLLEQVYIDFLFLGNGLRLQMPCVASADAMQGNTWCLQCTTTVDYCMASVVDYCMASVVDYCMASAVDY